MRSRSPRASSASRSTCSSQPSSAGRCAGIRPSGRRQHETSLAMSPSGRAGFAGAAVCNDRSTRSKVGDPPLSRRTYQTAAIAAEIAVPVAILLAWQAWTVQAKDPKFPRLSTILVEFRQMWLFSQFELHVVPSLTRIAAGFAIALALGILLGIPLGLSRWARICAMPHIEWWRAMPPPALLPISIVLLHSIGNVQKVSLIAFFCLFPILLNTIDGVRGIDPTLVETARSYGVPRNERIRR